MNTSATPFGLPADAPDLARRFAMIMAELGALVARRFVRMPHLSAFTMMLWTRLNRAVRCFHRALTSQAKMRPPMARTDRVVRARPAQLRLPRGRGWIVRELGWEAAAYLAQLEALLAEANTIARLAAAPRAGRVLRPICRMLGVAATVTPALATPVVPHAPSPPVINIAFTKHIAAHDVPALGAIFSGA